MNMIKYYSSDAFQNATVETFDSDWEELDLLLLKVRPQAVMLILSSALFYKCIYFINAFRDHCDWTSKLNYEKQSIPIITTHNSKH